ncbi:U3 small nucleolar RNA-associated protein 13 [Recurvomyces mirabilis]|uniref:U3 small nucleolar RNA-associated protein 13 n=1 Tax=Recurvomyces mirabilis TaxID=574656 RepID=A0AAE0WT29_9PEZI|nr:U3 small nucleolar RNA-associated protein 13 [Recurvomyces mirabilis]KAK5157366.1 U3 small nucleolar RNA-associated protein 13 [Recurvomyces mirabilis]
MALKADGKTTFEPARVIQPIYTGGAVALSEDGRLLATTLGEEALVTDLNTGAHLARIEGDGEPLTTLALSPDASYLVTCSRSLSLRTYALHPSETLDDAINAKLLRTIKPHSTPVITVAVDATSSLLATGAADGSIKVWDLRGGYTTHTFHGHSGIISALHFFEVDTIDSEQMGKGKKRKSKQRSAEAVEVQPDGATAGYRLASGGEDGKVRVWDLHKRKGVATLDAHVSVIRSLSYSPEARLLLSASRDKTAILWDARTWQQNSTVAVLEVVERAGFLMNGRFLFTAGETARVRIWSTEGGAELTEEQESGAENEAIVDVLHHNGLPFLLSVHADQTLLLYDLGYLTTLESTTTSQLPVLPVLRRISGTHDEVIDLAYIGTDRKQLALATNLEDIRIVSLDSVDEGTGSSYFGADVGLLKGHSDIIITLSIDWSGHWLATGAKDNTAKLWRLDPANVDYTCHSTFTGHAESIGAVALPSASPPSGSKEYNSPLGYPPKFLVTGSQDKTVKRWDVPASSGKAARAAYTRKAHDKDINAIATSYSSTSPLFASASQDRTVKIWDTETGEAVGVLRGHKRGVWSVAFSPPGMPALTTGEGGGASSAKGMVVTGSGDKTVRIWSLSDYNCLRTFEGHANSVLKVVWLPAPQAGRKGGSARNVQVASAAGDGLVKVWDTQSGECAATLDNHIDRVWALAVKPSTALEEKSKDDSEGVQMTDDNDGDEDEVEDVPQEATLELVSGSADSTLTFWHDTTSATALAVTQQTTQRVEQDQELQNYIRSQNYREAIVLALQLNHPKRLLDLFNAVVNGPQEPGSFVGKKDVDGVIASLSDNQLWDLLRRVRDWNANGRTHNTAQHVLHAILRLVPKDRLLRLRSRRRNKAADDDAEDVDGALAKGMKDVALRDKESLKDVLDGLKAYTQRHFERLEKVGEERFVLVWALQQMDAVGGAVDGIGNEKENNVMLLDGME